MFLFEDQIDLAGDVIAPERGHSHLETALARFAREVQRAQDLSLALARDGNAQDRLHACLAQADLPGWRILRKSLDVRDKRGHVRGALVVTAPLSRADDAWVKDAAAATLRVARELGDRAG